MSARLRTDDGWSDLTICNVSPRGLMGKCAHPPTRGAFIEVHRGGVCIVGHVRWSQGHRFGLRSQSSIDVAALGSEQIGTRRKQEVERRSQARADRPVVRATAIAAKADRSRAVARLFDWAAVVLAAAGFAWLLADQARTALSTPLQEARTALSSRP
jgi:hypothetical protein